MRGYVEKYNHVGAPARRFVGLANPLGGMFCGIDSPCVLFGEFDNFWNEFFHDLGYTDVFQKHLGLANYWRDPTQLENYTKYCGVLRAGDKIRYYRY